MKLISKIIIALLITAFSFPAFGQAPPHPRLLEKIRNNKIEKPYALKNIGKIRAGGVDKPWTSPQLHKKNGDVAKNVPQRIFGPASSPSGSWKALMILVQFSDKPAQVVATSFDNLVFKDSAGTLRDYYKNISYNTLDIVTVNLPSSTGWVNAPQSYSYYVNGQNGFGSYPQNAQKLVEDAVALAAPMVDYSKYDNDGDGYVDALFIVHSGPGAEFTGSSDDIWSHSWVTATPLSYDGVSIYHYSMEPEYWLTPGDMTIGVYAHELGHAAFGLPDLYDTDYSSAGLGVWSIMAGGSWNGATGMGESPSYPDGWCRIQMGFVSPTVVTANVISQAIPEVEDNATLFKLWKNGAPGSQYFLIENRQLTSYDQYLPNGGLLIYHVDESVVDDNNDEWYPGHTSSGHYLVALEQADGLFDLEHGYNWGDAGDPWPGSTNNISFSNSSTPDSKDYNFSATGVSVKKISSSSSTMNSDLVVVPTDTTLRVVSPNGGETWAVGYTKQIILDALNAGTLKLEYTADNGSTWNSIGDVNPSIRRTTVSSTACRSPKLKNTPEKDPVFNGSVINWVVPNSPSGQCKIRATSESNPALSDQSDSTFTIFAPPPGQFSIEFNYDALAVTGSTGNLGAVFIPNSNEFWTSRWASNLFHRWTKQGTLIEEFSISGVSNTTSMTYDGTYIYASSLFSTTISIIDPSTKTLTGTITSPFAALFITYDPTADGGNGGIWIGSWTTDLVLINKSGITLRTLPYANLNSAGNIGAAYDNFSPGGPYIWLSSQDNGQLISQISLATGLPTGIQHDITSDIGTGLSGGIFISTGIINGKATIGGILQGYPDRLYGYQLCDVAPNITVLSPNGNEQWGVGLLKKIKWSSGLIDNVEIEYSTDNGADWTQIIASTPAASGSYLWTIPNTLSTQAKVKISSTINPSVSDESDATFTIYLPPNMTVVPDSLVATLAKGDSTTQTMTIGNTGIGDLNWSATVNYSLSTSVRKYNQGTRIIPTSNPSNTPSLEIRKKNSHPKSFGLHNEKIAASGSFRETFESGILSSVWATNPNHSHEVTSATAANGTVYSLTQTRVASYPGHFDGVYANFPPIQPDHISLWIRVGDGMTSPYDAAAYFVLGDSAVESNFGAFWFMAQGDGHFAVYPFDASYSYTTNTWYHIQFLNINWTTKTFDYCVNDTLIVSGLPFRAQSTANFSQVHLYSYTPNVQAWWDEISIGGQELPWLSITPASGTVAPGGSENITAKLNSNGLQEGNYQSAIVITSNDSLNNPKNIPAHLTVNGISVISPNGGEIWRVGKSKQISWSSAGVSSVKIEYTTDNGVNWNTISASTLASNDTLSWTVPAVASNQCEIRISDASNPALFDVSDNPFTIAFTPTTETEPNNTAATANYIEYGDSLAATVDPVGDVDYYKFTAMAGDTVEIYTADRGSSSINGMIQLYDESGGWLNYNCYYSSWTDQRMISTITSSGTFYIRYSYQGNWGSFPNGTRKRDSVQKYTNILNKPKKSPSLSSYDAGDYYIKLKKFTPEVPTLSGFGYYYIDYNAIDLYIGLYPNGSNTTVTLDYGATTSYGSSMNMTGSPVNSLGEYDISYLLTSLQPNTMYHFRITLTNSVGTAVSGDMTLQTPAPPDGFVFQTSGISNYLFGVSFTDANNGWAVGDGGTILRTTNGGATWTQQTSGTGWGLNSVSFTDANNGCAVGGGYGGTILRTINGGTTWIQQTSGMSDWFSLNGVSFTDANNGCAVGDGGTILQTTDGGATWTQQSSGTDNLLYSVSFTDANNGCAVGECGIILRTTDGGTTWTQQTSGTNNYLYSVSFLDANNGYAVGGYCYGGIILRTTNGGTTWTQQTSGMNYWLSLYSVSFTDANNGCAVGDGYGGTILRTTDGGTTWTQQNSGTTNHLGGVSYKNNVITIVGGYGKIIRSMQSPSNLRASIVNNHVLLEWTPLAGATGYNIYRDTQYNFVPDVVNGTNLIAQNVQDADEGIPGIQWTDPATGVIGDTTIHHFWRITAISQGAESVRSKISQKIKSIPSKTSQSIESSPSNVAGEFAYPLYSTSGTDYNEVVLGMDTRQTRNPIHTAEDLANAIPYCTVVYMWNPLLQGYVGHPKGLSFNNFPVYPGYPYGVNIPVDTVWTVAGCAPDTSFHLVTTAGTSINHIGVPFGKSNLTDANTLVADIPGGTVVYSWVAGLQGAMGHPLGMPFNNFSVKAGYPYYVNVTSDTTWPIGPTMAPKSNVNASTKLAKENSIKPSSANTKLSKATISVKSSNLSLKKTLSSNLSLMKTDGSIKFSGGIPHMVYGKYNARNKAALKMRVWIAGRVDEVLTESIVGSGCDSTYWWVNIGALPTPWKNGETLEIELEDSISKLGGRTSIKLTKNGADCVDLIRVDKPVQTLGIEQNGNDIPKEYSLVGNYPNPFNPTTTIVFRLPECTDVTIEVFDMIGRSVKTLYSGTQKPGEYLLSWDGINNNGSKVSSGVYFYKMKTHAYVCTKKMLLIK